MQVKRPEPVGDVEGQAEGERKEVVAYEPGLVAANHVPRKKGQEGEAAEPVQKWRTQRARRRSRAA